MSTEDYELIAGVLRQAVEFNEMALHVPYESDEYYARHEGKRDVLDDVIRDMAVKLAEGNPRFDRDKFTKACMAGGA